MAEITNGYTTLQEFKDYAIPKSSVNPTDDAVIEDMIEAASRFIDNETRRTFYARTETRGFDLPDSGMRTLWLDDDLLTIITFSNGDGTVIAASDYILLPANETPSYAIKLKESSTVAWESDSSGNTEQALDVAGTWGFMSSASDDIKLACLEIAHGYYRRSKGKNVDGISRVTAAGVVIMPQDISKLAQRVIAKYARMV